MAKENIEKLKADRAALVQFAQYIRDWARFNDHGIKCKAMAVLTEVGEGQAE
jgi:hypothetical protein